MTIFSRNVAAAALLVSAVVLHGCALTEAGDAGTGSRPGVGGQSLEQRRIDVRMQLAVGYYEAQQYSVALGQVEQVIALAPSYADAYSMRGLIYMGLGDAVQAEGSFRQALRLDPMNPDVANNFGLLLCENGRLEEAVGHFDRALSARMYRTPVVAANNAGNCLLRQSRVDDAAGYFLRAVQFEPANPVANVHLAKWYLDQRDIERARFHMGFLESNDALSAEVLLLAIRMERRLGNGEREKRLAEQLSRRFPGSPEYVTYQRGALDE